MCGCNLTFLRDGFKGSDLIQDQALRTTLSNYKVIKAEDLQQGKTLAMLQYAFCLDSKQFIEKFANIGIDVNASLLPALSGIIDRGEDKAGVLTNSQTGKQVYFDGMKIVASMTFTPEQQRNAQCQIIMV